MSQSVPSGRSFARSSSSFPSERENVSMKSSTGDSRTVFSSTTCDIHLRSGVTSKPRFFITSNICCATLSSSSSFTSPFKRRDIVSSSTSMTCE